MKTREEIIDGLNDIIVVYPHDVYYEVAIYALENELPKVGDAFVDSRDHKWTVKEIRKSSLMWTNPPSPLPRWDMTLKGYPANTLESADRLTLSKD